MQIVNAVGPIRQIVAPDMTVRDERGYRGYLAIMSAEEAHPVQLQ